MNSSTESHKRFSILLDRVIDGHANASEIDEVIALAKENPELRSLLRSQLEMDNMLYQALSPRENTDQFIQNIIRQSEKVQAENTFEKQVLGALPTQHHAQPPKRHSKLAWSITCISIAACLVIFLLWLEQMRHAPTPIEPQLLTSNEFQDQGVAIISNTVGLTNPDLFIVGESIAPGHFEIDQGFIELEFYHGALVKIAGPAQLEIIDSQRIKLISGKVMTDIPNVAAGFNIGIPNYDVIHLGKAVGIKVDPQGNSQVHVFRGLVEIINPKGDKKVVTEGEAINFYAANIGEWETKLAMEKGFSEFTEIDRLTNNASNLKHEQWLTVRERLLNDKNLVSYFDFEPSINNPRALADIKENAAESHGAIVGASWSAGPWDGKSALEFKRPGDRVKIDVQGEFENFTLATWVRINSIDRRFSSLILTDGFEPGDIHWQIGNFVPSKKFGTIVLGTLNHAGKEWSYHISPFFTPADSGTWFHIAMTFDQREEQVKTYVNGKVIQTSRVVNKSKFWRLGKASIGNWESMQRKRAIRNLNGSMAELVILSRALNEDEIAQLALIQ